MDSIIFMVVTLIIVYIIMKVSAKYYRKVSDGNSIKQEESFAVQAVLFLFLGGIYILMVYIGKLFDANLQLIIFYSELVLLFLNVLVFLKILIGQIYNYFKYQKGGDVWLVIAMQFIKNLLFIYYVYMYYSTYIS